MSKKPKTEEVEEPKICMNCKHRQKPNGQHPIRGWCDNKKSPSFDLYIYKGDTCAKFSSKIKKGKEKESDE